MLSKILNENGIHQGVLRDHNSEAFHFLSINQQVLQREGADWLTPKVPKKESWYDITAEQLYAEHLKLSSVSWLRINTSIHKWGFKDPRTTFTLAMYLELFPKAKVIHIVRDGKDVALSLKHRNTVKGEVYDQRLDRLDFCFQLWEQYVIQGSNFQFLGKRYLELKYEDLITKNNSTINSLERFCGVNINKETLDFKERIQKSYPEELNEIAIKSDTYKKWYVK